VTEADALDLMRAALWTVIIACAPAVVCGMLVGLFVAFVQALTQVQESTLSFVPKMLAIIAALAVSLPFVGGQIALLTGRLYGHIATGF
jgi:flagellar biosynthetic protein FliQ